MTRIVVTGGAGFIGSNFVRYMLATNPELHIVNFDKLTYAGNLDNLKDLDPARHTFVQGDIADKAAILTAMDGCEAIVNFAAGSHVDRSIMGADDFIDTNVTGVYNICEAARELRTPRVLLVSTDEVYGSIDEGSFTEDDPPARAIPIRQARPAANSSPWPISTPSAPPSPSPAAPTPTDPISTRRRSFPSSSPTPSTTSPSRSTAAAKTTSATGSTSRTTAAASTWRSGKGSPARSTTSPAETNGAISSLPARSSASSAKAKT